MVSYTTSDLEILRCAFESNALFNTDEFHDFQRGNNKWNKIKLLCLLRSSITFCIKQAAISAVLTASSANIRARFKQRPVRKYAEDVIVLDKDLHV